MSCVVKTPNTRSISGQLRKSPRLCSNSHQINTRARCWACVTLSSVKSLTGGFKSRATSSTVWSLSTQSRNLGPKLTLSWKLATLKTVTPRLGFSAILRKTWSIALIRTPVPLWRPISRILKLSSSRRMAARPGGNSKRIRKLELRSSRCRKGALKSNLRRF